MQNSTFRIAALLSVSIISLIILWLAVLATCQNLVLLILHHHFMWYSFF